MGAEAAPVDTKPSKNILASCKFLVMDFNAIRDIMNSYESDVTQCTFMACTVCLIYVVALSRANHSIFSLPVE